MFDHLSQGRFIFGISPGALTSDAEALGILEQDRNKMFAEAIDVILAIWERDPPYDIDFPDNRYKVATDTHRRRSTSASAILGKPYQKPRPEIVGTVVAPFSPGVVLMGKRDFHPLSANFLLSKHLKSHWDELRQGQGRGRRRRPTSRTGASRAPSSSPTTTRPRARYGRDGREQPVPVLLDADAWPR